MPDRGGGVVWSRLWSRLCSRPTRRPRLQAGEFPRVIETLRKARKSPCAKEILYSPLTPIKMQLLFGLLKSWVYAFYE